MTTLPHARILGANDDVRVAVVGFRSKGMQHIGSFMELPGVRVVALCDVDTHVMRKGLDTYFKDAAIQPETFTDVRRLLDAADVDALVVATPNHWHAPITVWGCEAGKDVYVEKPCSHTLWEGQQIKAAAKKHGRIVQVGTQSRSDSGLQAAFKYIKDGNLGPIEYVRAINYRIRNPIGKVEGTKEVPDHIDYDLWLGPASREPLTRNELHYDWHWQWPYGNGELGNMGAHLLDLSAWALDEDKFPARVISVGGRFAFDDDGQTPNTHLVYYDYKPCPVLCEIRNLPRWKGEESADNWHGHRTGVQVKCRDGFYLGYLTGGAIYDNDGKRVKQFPGDGGGAHHQNFIDAVRARKPELLAADPAKGHLAAGVTHLGNISHRLGEKADGAKIRRSAEEAPLLAEAFERFNEHLLVNGIDVIKTPRILGPWLEFDPASERFTGERAEDANAFLKGTYRAGFELNPQTSA